MSDAPSNGPATPPPAGRSIADPVAVSLNAAGNVAAPEAICLRCGYTIHGLPGTGACPECGTPVADSLRGRLLRFSDRDYVQTLHRGVMCLLVGLVLAFSAQLLGTVAGAGIGVYGIINARAGAAPAPVVTVTPKNPTIPTTPDGSLPPDTALDPAAAPAAAPAAEAEVIPPPTVVEGDEPDSASDATSPENDPVQPEIDAGADVDAAAAPAPAGDTTGRTRVTRQIGGFTITPGGGAGGGGGGLPSFLQTLITIFSFVAAAFEVLVLLGWWWFSSPDPALPEGERGDGPRRVIRIVVVLVAISTFLGLGLTQAGMTGFTPSFGLFGVIGFTALAEFSKIARFFASMLYLRWLSPRLPDELVDRRTRLYIWLLPVIYVVGACVLGIGPLVAAVMQWILLLRVRNDLKQILDEMPESGGSGGLASARGR